MTTLVMVDIMINFHGKYICIGYNGAVSNKYGKTLSQASSISSEALNIPLTSLRSVE